MPGHPLNEKNAPEDTDELNEKEPILKKVEPSFKNNAGDNTLDASAIRRIGPDISAQQKLCISAEDEAITDSTGKVEVLKEIKEEDSDRNASAMLRSKSGKVRAVGRLPAEHFCPEEDCAKKFIFQRNLRKHQRLKHQRPTSKKKTTIPKTEEDKFACDDCGAIATDL